MFRTVTGTALMNVSSGAKSLVVLRIDMSNYKSKSVLFPFSFGVRTTLA
jgi:hypothetical protein